MAQKPPSYRELEQAIANSNLNAEEWLIELARTHESSKLRRSAIVRLRKLGSVKVRSLLIAILVSEHTNQNLRETAIKSLGEVGDEETLGLLRHIVESENIAKFGQQAAQNALNRLQSRLSYYQSSSATHSYGKFEFQRPQSDAQTQPVRKTMSTVPQIFISYARVDADWLTQLEMHLKPMVRNAKLDTWSDAKIQSSSQWENEIMTALRIAAAGVLLVTPAFLASDFIFQKELPELLQKKVLWVAVDYCNYKETEIFKYQATNDPDRPLASLQPSERNKEWVSISQKIKAALSNP